MSRDDYLTTSTNSPILLYTITRTGYGGRVGTTSYYILYTPIKYVLREDVGIPMFFTR